MQLAHIVPCRDKEKHVAKTVYSVLEQTYPCHVVLSDQGSTDRTFEILMSIARGYRGEHKLSVLQCPVTEPRGMRGMNAHLDWIMSMINEDVVMITPADDLSLPGRNAAVVEAFEKHKPDMVLNAIHFAEPDGTYYGTTAVSLERDGFIDPVKCLQGLVGGSTAHAWTREFYEAAGPFDGICSFDAYWPFLATMRNGAWFTQEPQLIYVRHVDENNTGLEGVHRAEDERGKKALEELMHFQVATAYIRAGHILEAWGCTNEEAKLALFNEILGRAVSWSKTREEMTLLKIPPRELRA